MGLFSYLPISKDNKLSRRQRLQSHGPSGMEFLGTYPYLRTKSKLESIGKPCRSINENRCRIYFFLEFHSIVIIIGDDCL